MPHARVFLAAGFAFLFALLSGCTDEYATTAEPLAYAVDMPRPGGTEPLATPIPRDSIYFHEDREFGGSVTRLTDVTAMAPGELHRVGAAADRASSAEWSLPPGVLVVLYENANGTGDEFAMWGAGQAQALSRWRFNDRVSRWAWFYIGGVPNAPVNIQRALTERPLKAEQTGPVDSGIIEMYRDANFKGTMTILGPIKNAPIGELQKPGSLADQMTSLRWNLPPGVIVVLCENAGGTGRQLPLWGTGQYSSVSPFRFNDQVSRWAWYDVTRR